MLAVLASPAARAEWWEAQTSHFVVYSESDKGDAEKFATTLERFDNALRTLQGMPVPGPEVGPANRVKVYRTGDTDNIAVFAHASGSGVAGFYIRSEEHTSELQSLMRISYAVFCLKKKNTNIPTIID